jgi:CRP/FNR family transcriptional regulator
LLKLSEKFPEICMAIASTMAERLYHLISVIEILNVSNATVRVARYLLQRSQGKNYIENFQTTLSARELGLTPEAVSRTLRHLKEAGLIEKKGRVVKILNPKQLKVLAGLESV